jgi:septal ring factor EnvC (AmiA/AmiB activator)
MRSSTETIIGAMKILSHDIYCEDGVATAAIAEAADRLEEIAAENKKLKTELQEAKDYADRLVEHKDMVCLPADLANLREANAHFAAENEALKKQRDRLAKALQMITTFNYEDNQCDNGWGARYVAQQAIQSLTPNEL